MTRWTDSATMLRRDLRHALRYPSMTFGVAFVPVIMLLMFAYLFGSVMSLGIAQPGVAYIDFLVPGVLLMTLGSGSTRTAVSVCTDLADGIVARFRTMPITRTAILTGHVLGSVIQTTFSIVLVVGISLAMGFRPTAGPLEWLAALGLMIAATFGITWLAVALGMTARNAEGASNAVQPLSFFLPFLSTAFVPLASLPSGIRWFAEYQPFTPLIETLRGLLTGGLIGHYGWLAIGWCVVMTAAGYAWARHLFNRDPRP